MSDELDSEDFEEAARVLEKLERLAAKGDDDAQARLKRVYAATRALRRAMVREILGRRR